MELDDRGIPTEINESGTGASHCPPQACQLCYGISAVDQTPEEQIAEAIYKIHNSYASAPDSFVNWYKLSNSTRNSWISTVKDALKNGFIFSNLDNRKLTSWEWCQMMDTCAATVDWDKITENRMDR